MAQRTQGAADGVTVRGLTFDHWMSQLNALVMDEYGMSIHDLPDMMFRDAFDARVSPLEFFEDELGTTDQLSEVIFG